MVTLNDHPNFFEILPVEVIGNILDQLNQVTGSQGIINQADLPVIMKYVENFALTSKALAQKVNHLIATDLFLKSLSSKYDKPCEHFAALFNTRGARKWIWQSITQNELDKTYQIIQDIQAFALDVLNEAKIAEIEYKLFDGRKQDLKPNPFYYQTKQGIALYLYRDDGPSHLATPFGEIKIYEGAKSKENFPLSISEIFIKRSKAVFDSKNCEERFENKGELFEIASLPDHYSIRVIDPTELKKISENKLKSKVSTQNLIVNSCKLSTIYQMREIKGKQIPDLIWYENYQFHRPYNFINTMWEMLEFNNSGLDPITTKKKNEKILCQLEEIQYPLLKDISEIPQWGIDLVKKLNQQPFFQGKPQSNTRNKILILKNYTEVRAIKKLNSNAKQFLNKGSDWSIYSFGYGYKRRFLEGKDLEEGIELQVNDDSIPCTIQDLKLVYETVIDHLSQNWMRAELKDYPAIFWTKSEEEYILFVKTEKILIQENGLINCIANKLGLSKFIYCYNKWRDKALTDLYMWIRKEGYEQTLQLLNIIPKI